MANSNTAPDLQSILDNLARFAPQHSPAQDSTNGSNVHNTTSPVVTAQSKEAASTGSSDFKPSDLRLKPQSRSTASPKPIDPATITTWQEGLRCVTKIAAQNAQFAASIRRMIDVQKKNEMRWYAERQNLLQTQANRAKSSAQAQSILKSLSNSFTTGSGEVAGLTNDDAAAKELVDFDRKIHAAQVEVDISMTAELKALSVPYFGTDPSLVVKDGALKSEEDGNGDRPKWSPKITEVQLLELRKRMIQHLEDLYRD